MKRTGISAGPLSKLTVPELPCYVVMTVVPVIDSHVTTEPAASRFLWDVAG